MNTFASNGPAPGSRGRLSLVLANSAANGIRAVSGSLVLVVLPLVLVAVLAKEDFAVWAICFSFASYALYLDLGIPTTIQSLVSRFDGEGDPAAARRVAWVGIRLVGAISLACLALASVVAVNFRSILPAVPAELVGTAGPVLLIALAGQLANLLASAASAYFAGLQRSAEPTRVMVPARVASLALAALAAVLDGGLIAVATAYALPLVSACGIILLRLLREGRTATGEFDRRRASVAAILGYSGPMIVWNVSLLLVTGAGLALVARLDYSAVAAYAVATTFAAGITALDGALLASLIPEFSRAHVAGDRARLTLGVLRAGRVNSVFVLTAAAGIACLAPVVSHLLIESGDRALGVILVIGVSAAAVIRSLAAPLSLAFVATGEHKRIYWPPVAEAVVTFALCLGLGSLAGARGVVLGSVIGAILGTTLAFSVSRRIAGVIDVGFWRLAVHTILVPLLPLVPLAGAIVVTGAVGEWQTITGAGVVFCFGLVALGLMWLVLPATERTRIRAIGPRRGPAARDETLS